MVRNGARADARQPIGVGFIGAGPVTQSIHLPALARIGDPFRVVHVTDVDELVAQAVAARIGARYSTDVQDLLADSAVDVVAVCSPPRFHAAHVQAACAAGVKAILCEKPFATTTGEAREIARAAADSGVPVIVGAMHAFDPAWTRASHHWGRLCEEATFVQSAIYMPGGTRFEDFATEIVKRPPPQVVAVDTPWARARRLESIILGLIIHDLPLVRALAPSIDQVLSAVVEAHTWSIIYQGSGRTVQLDGGMLGGWKPEWTFEAYSPDTAVEIEFNPSYVWAGSGRSSVTSAGVRHEHHRADHNGYEGEWRAIASIVAEGAEAPVTVGDQIADLRYALDLIAKTSGFLDVDGAA